MKYWLLAFIFNLQTDEFIRKDQTPFQSRARCEEIARGVNERYKNNTQFRIVTICVSDDHFTGRRLDPGVPNHVY